MTRCEPLYTFPNIARTPTAGSQLWLCSEHAGEEVTMGSPDISVLSTFILTLSWWGYSPSRMTIGNKFRMDKSIMEVCGLKHYSNLYALKQEILPAPFGKIDLENSFNLKCYLLWFHYPRLMSLLNLQTLNADTVKRSSIQSLVMPSKFT